MMDIQKNPSPTLGANRVPAGSGSAGLGAGPAASADVEAFRSAMSRPQAEGSGQGLRQGSGQGSGSAGLERPDDLFKNADRRHDLESGEALEKKPSESNADGRLKGSDFIDAMFGRTQTDAFMQAAAPRAEGAAASGFPEGDLNALVSRILVSSPEKGSTEVRLTLSDAALRGTEVTLLRDAAGMLSVKIVAADPRAFQTLVASRGELVSALEAQESEGVSVVMEDGSDANDTRQRSRGLDALDNHE